MRTTFSLWREQLVTLLLLMGNLGGHNSHTEAQTPARVPWPNLVEHQRHHASWPTLATDGVLPHTRCDDWLKLAAGHNFCVANFVMNRTEQNRFVMTCQSHQPSTCKAAKFNVVRLPPHCLLHSTVVDPEEAPNTNHHHQQQQQQQQPQQHQRTNRTAEQPVQRGGQGSLRSSWATRAVRAVTLAPQKQQQQLLLPTNQQR